MSEKKVRGGDRTVRPFLKCRGKGGGKRHELELNTRGKQQIEEWKLQWDSRSAIAALTFTSAEGGKQTAKTPQVRERVRRRIEGRMTVSVGQMGTKGRHGIGPSHAQRLGRCERA